MQRGWGYCLALALLLAGCASRTVAPAPQAVANVVPLPAQMQLAHGTLHLPRQVAVISDAGAVDARAALDRLLTTLQITASDTAAVQLRLALVSDVALGDEGYRLTIGNSVQLQAQTDIGLFYGVQTLRQLLPTQAGQPLELPHLNIVDVPRYGWRGLSLDVARSFLPVSYLEQQIDRMALFKFNRLHLHLTDDQGWRIEIKRYPKLMEIGGASAVQGGRPGYYTQDELRHLVRYAQARGITLVPEIDMPGHVQAALASYHELACDGVTNLAPYAGVAVGFSVLCLEKPDVVYPFVQHVLEEVAAIFPSEYIHMGGDEIKDPRYAEFVSRTSAMVIAMGRKPIAWEEASVGDTSPSLRLQLWNDNYPIQAAVEKGHQLILSPCSYLYIDHSNYAGQPETYTWCRKEGVPLERVYAFDPGKFSNVAGVEAALWSELVHTDAAADNRLWPRLGAVAEVAWSPADGRNFDGFRKRMGALRPQLDALGIHYYPAPELGW